MAFSWNKTISVGTIIGVGGIESELNEIIANADTVVASHCGANKSSVNGNRAQDSSDRANNSNNSNKSDRTYCSGYYNCA